MGHVLHDWGLPENADYTAEECSDWMREAGFKETRSEHLNGPESMIVGLK
jgi:hypothetical protein